MASSSSIIAEFKTAVCETFFDLPRAERGRVSAWFAGGALLLAAGVGLAVHLWHCRAARRAAARARHARRDEEEATRAAAQAQEAATAAAAQEAATAHARVSQLERHLAASQVRAAALQRDLARHQAWSGRMEMKFGQLREAREAEEQISRTTRAMYDEAKDEVNRLRRLLAEKDGMSAAMVPLQGARPGSSETSAQAEASERGGRTAADGLPAGERPAVEVEAPEDSSDYFSSTSYT